MREQTWYERIINFFCKIFHKDSKEMNNKFKTEMCEHVKSQNLCQGYCDSCAWKLDEEKIYQNVNIYKRKGV